MLERMQDLDSNSQGITNVVIIIAKSYRQVLTISTYYLITKFFNRGNSFDLEISQLRLSDGGEYRCEVFDIFDIFENIDLCEVFRHNISQSAS